MSFIQTLSIGSVFGKIWPFAVAIFFFGLLIFFHELGHFLCARIFKVKVNEFAMGMGPAIFKFKKKDTQYSLRVFPIGGYCAMEGEDSNSEDEGAFCNKKAWQRFIIVAAGGIVNIIMGIIIVMIMLASSKSLIGTPYIHSFDKNAVSNSCGLEVGDKIEKINGRRIFSDYDISYFMSTDDDGVFDFTVKRDGKKRTAFLPSLLLPTAYCLMPQNLKSLIPCSIFSSLASLEFWPGFAIFTCAFTHNGMVNSSIPAIMRNLRFIMID